MATGVMVPGPDVGTTTSAQRKVIVASTLGTTFSWYDFNLFAAFSPVIGHHFFPDADNNTDLVFALLAFSAGFIVRPLGAVLSLRPVAAGARRSGDVVHQGHELRALALDLLHDLQE